MGRQEFRLAIICGKGAKMANDDEKSFEGETGVLEEESLKEPDRYRVLLHNDDVTTMDFVVSILCAVFHKSREEAVRIMLMVHQQGVGECGIFTQEIAESKVHLVIHQARLAEFPLNCTMEKV